MTRRTVFGALLATPFSCLLTLGAALPLASLAAPMTVAEPAADVNLQVHEQRPWKLPADLRRIAIADPSVVDLVRSKRGQEALLVAKKPGQTTVQLWQRNQSAPQSLVVRVHGALQAPLQAGTGVHVQVQDDQALLSGSAPSLLAHQQALDAAASAVGSKGTITDVSTIANDPVVQVDVKVVEFDKTAMSQIGLNFSASNNGFSYGFGKNTRVGGGTGDTAAGSALSSAFNLVLGHKSADGRHAWSGNIDLLQSDGMARVLAEPTLVALSGQSASFLAGGELPIPVPQGLGTTTITYKSFGIGLTVTPTVLGPDRIALKVAPEASDLDYTNAVILNNVSVPAITTRRADTTVELGDGETFVIGGLVSQNITSQVSKIPLLGDIPIIGAFFRDLRYNRQDKELVILVTPHLVRPMARGVTLPLPGEDKTQKKPAVWGSWLLNPAGPDQLPGFSR